MQIGISRVYSLSILSLLRLTLLLPSPQDVNPSSSSAGRQLLLAYSPQGSSPPPQHSLQNAPFPLSGTGGKHNINGSQDLSAPQQQDCAQVLSFHLDATDTGDALGGLEAHQMLHVTLQEEPYSDQFPFALDTTGEGLPPLVTPECAKDLLALPGGDAGGRAHAASAALRAGGTSARRGGHLEDAYSHLIPDTLNSLGRLGLHGWVGHVDESN